MEEESGFDSVSWDRNGQAGTSPSTSLGPEPRLPHRPTSNRRSSSTGSVPQAGENADQVDLAGVGREGVLECTVDTPTKENDGTKDAYVSYLVTTHVRVHLLDTRSDANGV